ncbi:MAG: hypothetical protein LBN28_02730, partial [Desulfovibrio sp.]|nr:hypothetical protein [Desulfovibrio sp.]
MNIVPIVRAGHMSMPVKQFMATLLAIGMFMGYPFLAGADDDLNSDQIITVDGDILGGGILGEEDGTTNHATIPLGSLENLTFDNNTITASGSIHGGGIVGGYATSNLAGPVISKIDNLAFTNNTISTNVLQGGGILGSDRASIGDITNTVFTDNTVAVGGNIYGGGIIGGDVG